MAFMLSIQYSILHFYLIGPVVTGSLTTASVAAAAPSFFQLVGALFILPLTQHYSQLLLQKQPHSHSYSNYFSHNQNIIGAIIVAITMFSTD